MMTSWAYEISRVVCAERCPSQTPESWSNDRDEHRRGEEPHRDPADQAAVSDQ